MSNVRNDFKERLELVLPELTLIKEEGRYAYVQDKYGILKVRKDTLLKGSIPKINSAIDKTQYFKNQLIEKFPNALQRITIHSEFVNYKEGLICEDQFGLVKLSPNSLMEGNFGSQRTVINYKDYLAKKLKFIHRQFNYDFEVIDSEYYYLVCPEHGKIKVLNRYLLLGYQCPICKAELGSNVLYLIKLTNQDESFYKIGISRRTNKGILRYKDYHNYNITPIVEIDFDNSGDSKVLEQQVKELIKDCQYNPLNWNNTTSRECFTLEKLNEVKILIMDYIKNCDRIQINGCNGLCKSNSTYQPKDSGCGCSK